MTLARDSLPLLLALGCASGGPRDVVPDTHDVRTTQNTGDSYVYVAKRPLGSVGLAEARGVSEEDGKRAVDKLAEALDACARSQASQGKLAGGAARIVADVDDGGFVGPPKVTLSPGAASQANAILCLVAPFRALQFSPREADAGARGIALEATWGGP